MAKRLRVRDKLLLVMAILGDTYFEICEPLSVQLKKMKGFLPSDYKTTNFTASISRLLSTGEIEKVIKDGKPYLRISNSGKNIIKRDFSFFDLAKKRWDGLWRIVFYDIPEENRYKREKLQLKLCELGFGMVKESTYITPYDVAEDLHGFLINEKLEELVFVCVSKQLFAGDIQDLVQKVWNIKELQKRYLNLIEKINENNFNISYFLNEYEEVLRDDPCLPKELLPKDWLGDKVNHEFSILLKK